MADAICLKFVQFDVLKKEHLINFKQKLDVWFPEAVCGGAVVQKRLVLVPPHGHSKNRIYESTEFAILDLFCFDRCNSYSSSELRIIERAWFQSVPCAPVNLWNDAQISHTPARITAATSIEDLSFFLGFNIPRALREHVILFHSAEHGGVVAGLKCFSCQLVLPPERFSGKPLLKIIKDIFCYGICTRCDDCTENFFW